jgi:hypothetical protein
MLIRPNYTSGTNGKIVKNGKTYYGKQNHKCKDCNRQFVICNLVIPKSKWFGTFHLPSRTLTSLKNLAEAKASPTFRSAASSRFCLVRNRAGCALIVLNHSVLGITCQTNAQNGDDIPHRRRLPSPAERGAGVRLRAERASMLVHFVVHS